MVSFAFISDIVACGPAATVVDERGPKNSVPQWSMPVPGDFTVRRRLSASAPLIV
jgi:hypothetical protein